MKRTMACAKEELEKQNKASSDERGFDSKSDNHVNPAHMKET